MTYHVAYNPSFGNALVALSDQPIDHVDGLVVKNYPGELPDLSRFVWNPATLSFYEKPRRRITRLEFMNRMTDVELAGVYTAAKASVAVEVWLAKFHSTTPEADGTSVDLDDPRTVAGVQALEAAGLLAAGRATEILGG